MTNYYQVLGVAANAPESEIKSAFRRLAKETHPDLNPGADTAKRFMQVNEAYEILSDPKRRQQHDLNLAGFQTKTAQPQQPKAQQRPNPDAAAYEEALRRARAKAQQRAQMRYQDFERSTADKVSDGVAMALQIPLLIFSLALCALLVALPFALMVRFHWAFVFLAALTTPFGLTFLKSIRGNVREIFPRKP
jgi:hypothetical protein